METEWNISNKEKCSGLFFIRTPSQFSTSLDYIVLCGERQKYKRTLINPALKKERFAKWQLLISLQSNTKQGISTKKIHQLGGYKRKRG